jgi:hypothetical protein
MHLIKETPMVFAEDDFMTSRWRPAMGWSYLAICLFDFLAAPLLVNILQVTSHGLGAQAIWQPVTLQGGGLFHMAMGSVLGITSWMRGAEKIQRLNLFQNQTDPLNTPPEPAYPAYANMPPQQPVWTPSAGAATPGYSARPTGLKLKPLVGTAG